ncbi:hypothetical protein MKW98_023730 [Papaver atlanticum]|uniref:COBRA C-terminal domain-containing protein n=1 Tax=Papaver atlanticum TaxID=357466 RepID=A0AAD4XML1_9MAGN|nr:hypothetical protein MKW98_023730 [Papaver atlanticum]
MGFSSFFRYIFVCFSLLFHLHVHKADGYDQLDPQEIKWDILTWEDDTYNAQISILNKQAFRHIEKPGWRLSWTWQNKEVIWSMSGAEATEQGDCTRIKGSIPPHSCEQQPVIIDLLPGAPYNMQTSNCCKGGVLTTEIQDLPNMEHFFKCPLERHCLWRLLMALQNPRDTGKDKRQSPAKVASHDKNHKKKHHFNVKGVDGEKKEKEMKTKFHDSHKKRVLIGSDAVCDDAGDGHTNTTVKIPDPVDMIIPQNFSNGIPGYTCGPPKLVAPYVVNFGHLGRNSADFFDTWKLTCTYSQMQASQTPTCCVSMSSFYNETIVQCPTCSCACRRDPTKHCVDPTKDLQPLIELPHSEDEVVPPKVRCTDHMCPIRIHWHVKTSYKDYWRVKVTVNNFNYVKNYSEWSLVVQHPNLRSLHQVFSFNYKPLLVFPINDTGMFWGIPFYNNMLMRSSVEAGNVQTEILFKKDPGFTFGGGFAFPWKISFNGDACVMPLPDQYPRLPNSGFSLSSNSRPILFSVFLLLLSLYIVY